MPSEKILDPMDINIWLYVAAGILILLLLLWVIVRIWRFQSKKYKVKVHRVTVTQREVWEQRIRDIVAKYSGTDEQARMLHIVLAATLRDMLSERVNRDVSSWTVDELRSIPQFHRTADLIESWEEPSFAPYAKANVNEATHRAIEVVRSW